MRGKPGSSPECSRPDCDLKSRANGLCPKHLMKLRMTGTFEKIAGSPEYLERLRFDRFSRRSGLSLIDASRMPNDKTRFASKYRVSQIKRSIKIKGYDFYLSDEEIYKFIISDCYYCGKSSGWPSERNGIDRINSKIGYHFKNCVSSCFTCNAAKGDMDANNFIAWAKRFCLYNGIIRK